MEVRYVFIDEAATKTVSALHGTTMDFDSNYKKSLQWTDRDWLMDHKYALTS